MNNIYGIKDSAHVQIIKKATGRPFLYAPYCTEVSNQWSQDSVYALDKSTRAIRWDYNRQSTLKMTMEIFDLKWLSLLTGSEFDEGVTELRQREAVEVKGSKVTLSKTPKVGSLVVYKLDEDNLRELDEQVVGDPTTANNYSISGNQITLNPTSCPDGTYVELCYLIDSEATAKTLHIDSDTFSFPVEIYMDTMVRDTDGLDKFVELHYLNAKAKGNFTLTFSASAITKLEVEFDVLKDIATGDMATFKYI